MYGECEDCVKTDLNEDMLLVNKDDESDESSSSSDSDSDLKICDGKLKKLERSNTDGIVVLNNHIATLKKHIYVKRVQVKSYNDLKDNLKENDLLIHVDYSESYENKQQREIQSAYFGHTDLAFSRPAAT